MWTDADDGFAIGIADIPPDVASGAAIVAVEPVTIPREVTVAMIPPDEFEADDMAAAPVDDSPVTVEPVAQTDDLMEALKARFAAASRGAVDAAEGRQEEKEAPTKFAANYRALYRLAAIAALPRLQEEAALAQSIVIGTASTYNPYRDGPLEGGPETASGELYDPTAWTAAIQTKLRGQFRGVRYGRLYQPAYALVACEDKQVIVKINDVGPLRPGRVIDLNERAMRYFDPFLRRGLLPDVRVTLLPGDDWTPGPVGDMRLGAFASAR